MAEYRVTSPDGQTYKVTGPDGASDAEVLSQVEAFSKQGAPKKGDTTKPAGEDTSSPTAGFLSGNLNKGIAGILGNVLDLPANLGNAATAMFAPPRPDSPGGPPMPAQLPFPMPGRGAQLVESGMQKLGLMSPHAEAESPGGRVAASGIQALPGLFMGRPTPAQIPRAATAAFTSGAGGQVGAEVAPAGYEQAGAAIGSALPGGKKMIASPPKGEAASAEQRAQRFEQARAMDLPVKPREMKPDAADQKVQNVVTKELGLPEGAPLSAKTLGGYSAEQYRTGYEPLLNDPKLGGKIRNTPTFARQVQQLAKEEREQRQEFPESTPERLGANQKYLLDFIKPKWTVKGVMTKIRDLRKDATDNLTKTDGDRQLGHIQRRLAGSMEDMIEENLKRVAPTQSALTQNTSTARLDAFREARKRIAQAHTVESAIDPRTGKVDPARLAMLEQEGAPLSGGLKEIAQVASEFPQSARPPNLSDDIFTKRITPMAVLHPFAAMSHLASRLGEPVTLSAPWQDRVLNPRAKLTPEQERILRFVSGQHLQPPPQ